MVIIARHKLREVIRRAIRGAGALAPSISSERRDATKGCAKTSRPEKNLLSSKANPLTREAGAALRGGSIFPVALEARLVGSVFRDAVVALVHLPALATIHADDRLV